MDYKILSDELHKPVINKFKSRSVNVYNINEIWSADLDDLQEWKADNDGYKYILTVIDIFSKIAWAKPLRSKTGKEVYQNLKQIIKENGKKPANLWVDEGKEFYNKDVKKLKIKLYSTYSKNKASIIERFNRTLKTKMWKKFTELQTRRWVDILPHLINDYNNTVHRTINMKPLEVKDNINKVQQIFIKKNLVTSNKKQKFKIGDKVRISRIKGIFEKGYYQSWSYEVFIIDKVLKTRPIKNKLKDLNNEIFEFSFYEQELQKTKLDNIFLIEKTLKTRTIKGKKEYLVKYLGYDDKYNDWIKEKDFV